MWKGEEWKWGAGSRCSSSHAHTDVIHSVRSDSKARAHDPNAACKYFIHVGLDSEDGPEYGSEWSFEWRCKSSLLLQDPVSHSGQQMTACRGPMSRSRKQKPPSLLVSLLHWYTKDYSLYIWRFHLTIMASNHSWTSPWINLIQF